MERASIPLTGATEIDPAAAELAARGSGSDASDVVLAFAAQPFARSSGPATASELAYGPTTPGTPDYGSEEAPAHDPTQMVFRYAKRSPEQIFANHNDGKDGFRPRGNSANIDEHLKGSPNSAYVSTTTRLSENMLHFGQWRFVIDHDGRGIDIEAEGLYQKYPQFKTEHEVAKYGGVPTQQIKGAYQIRYDSQTGERIGMVWRPNPNYVPGYEKAF
jgi:hypothetical protein